MLSRTTHLLITLAVLNTLAIGLYTGFFVWLRRTTLETTELVADLRHQTERETHLRSVSQLVTNTASERAALTGYFATEDRAVEVITLLESLGEDARVDELEILSVADDAGIQPNVPALSLRVQATGSWNSLYHLLSLIETAPQTVFVDSVSLSHQPASGEGASSTAAFWRGTVTVKSLLVPSGSAGENS